MTADTIGGVWSYALELAHGLAELGVEIDLATMGAPPSPAQRRQVGQLPHVRLHARRLRLEWMTDAWDEVDRAGEWLLELAQRCDSELIHLNGYSHAALAWQAPVVVVGHSCVWSWFEAVHRSPPPAEWAEYHRRVRAGLLAADAIVAPSQGMAAALRRHYGPVPGIRVVANGRRAELFPPRAKAPLIFSCGRLWDAAKNLALLEAAAPHLSWPVFVAGEPAHPEGGSRDFAAVQAVGVLDQLQLSEWYGRAAIYALPARYEPFGLSVLEAALAGCALVLGDIGSLRENWDDSACWVDPDDGDQLARTLQQLIDDRERRADLAARARQQALRFTSAHSVALYATLYAELLPRQRHSEESLACVS
ncbi:MAG TPA: glycosyltransferase family 4 protein [Terriglobales bacterium]|nr:glycosyltransferase family 4 protein [Terriglobales bacterium]